MPKYISWDASTHCTNNLEGLTNHILHSIIMWDIQTMSSLEAKERSLWLRWSYRRLWRKIRPGSWLWVRCMNQPLGGGEERRGGFQKDRKTSVIAVQDLVRRGGDKSPRNVHWVCCSAGWKHNPQPLGPHLVIPHTAMWTLELFLFPRSSQLCPGTSQMATWTGNEKSRRHVD